MARSNEVYFCPAIPGRTPCPAGAPPSTKHAPFRSQSMPTARRPSLGFKLTRSGSVLLALFGFLVAALAVVVIAPLCMRWQQGLDNPPGLDGFYHLARL